MATFATFNICGEWIELHEYVASMYYEQPCKRDDSGVPEWLARDLEQFCNDPSALVR